MTVSRQTFKPDVTVNASPFGEFVRLDFRSPTSSAMMIATPDQALDMGAEITKVARAVRRAKREAAEAKGPTLPRQKQRKPRSSRRAKRV